MGSVRASGAPLQMQQQNRLLSLSRIMSPLTNLNTPTIPSVPSPVKPCTAFAFAQAGQPGVLDIPRNGKAFRVRRLVAALAVRGARRLPQGAVRL